MSRHKFEYGFKNLFIHGFYQHARWVVLSSSMLTAMGADTAYAFGIFSEKLKHNLHYNQHDIDLIGSIGEAGQFLGIFAGLFYSQFGPKKTLLTGCLMSTFGFYLLYLYVSRTLESTLTLVCIATFVALFGNCFRVAAATATVVRNFPASERGKVVGLIKGSFAIGASVYSEFYMGMFSPNISSFLLFLSIFIGIQSILCTLCIRIVPYDNNIKESNNLSFSFLGWYINICILGFYLLGLSIAHIFMDFSALSNEICVIILWIIMLGLGILPYILHPKECNQSKGSFIELFEFKNESCPNSLNPISKKDEEERLPTCIENHFEERKALQYEKEQVEIKNPSTKSLESKQRNVHNENWEDEEECNEQMLPTEETNLRIYQAISELNFWILFCIFLICAGSGLVIINNISQIHATYYSISKSNAPSSHVRVYVCMIGIGNFFGRLLIGFLSDKWMEFCSRTSFLSICCCLMALAHALLSLHSFSCLFPSVLLVAFSYGGLFSMLPSIVADIFGSKYFAENYGALDLAPAFGSIIYATWITNVFYEETYSIHTKSYQDCIGVHCFQMTFYISSISCIIAGISCIYLGKRINNDL